MTKALTRRGVLMGLAASPILANTHVLAQAGLPFRLGLTPVFLDNDAEVITQLRTALQTAMGQSIELVQRRTYQEVTGMLLEGSVDAAWICGFPFLQHAQALSLVAVPVWRGKPLYQSYLIVGQNDAAEDLADLEGGTHAFSDPDSNSGWLVTVSDLTRMKRTPEDFFQRTVFTYGHRNVVRSVASGLTRSGSVDGYVWDVLAEVDPGLTRATRVIRRSEWLGFPPLAAHRDRTNDPVIEVFRRALFDMKGTQAGEAALRSLHLDAFAPGDLALFAGIAARMRDVDGLR